MVKIIYLGDITPCKVKIYSTIINPWSKGEIKDLSDRNAEKLLRENKNFSLADGKHNKKLDEDKQEEKPKEDEKNALDLDGDGDVDSDDYTIAAKTLAHARKKK
jgi:hypothetical protein